MADTLLRFTVDSSLAYPADSFTAEYAGHETFTAADPAQRVALAAGLLDALDAAQTVSQLRDGVIDKAMLSVRPDSITSRIEGRSLMALAIDRQVRMRFLKTPRPAVVESLDPDAMDDQVTEFEGVFTTDQVAQIVCTAAGLTCVWQAPRHTLREDFDAVDTVLAILTRLAEPWNQTIPYGVDIRCRNGTVYVTQRPGTSLTADYTFTIPNARLDALDLTSAQTTKYGIVSLTGATYSGDLSTQSGGGGGGDTDIPAEGAPLVGTTRDDTQTFSTYDPQTGKKIGMVTTTTTYRMPDVIPIYVRQAQYTFVPSEKLTGETTTYIDVEPSVYDSRGAINQPKPTGQRTLVKGTDPATNADFVPLQAIEIAHTYDARKFMRVQSKLTMKYEDQTTATFARDGDGNQILDGSGNPTFDSQTTRVPVPAEFEYQVWEDAAQHMLRHITTKYMTATRTLSDGTTVREWRMTSQNVVPAGGLPPGGIQPPAPVTVDRDNDNPNDFTSSHALRHHTLTETISTDADAIDVRYHNPHLDAADLRAVMALYRAASGLTETEYQWGGPAFALLQVGQGFSLTGLLAADGTTPITTGTVLVSELNVTCDETSDPPGLTCQARGVRWDS